MKPIRVFSVDPGLSHCGVSVIELTKHGDINFLFAETIDTDSYIKSLNYIVDLHGKRQARLAAISKRINNILTFYKPNVAASEIPFWNPGRPAAFEPLVAVVTTIANLIFEYDPSIGFERVPAAKVKSNLQVVGSSSDKSLVKSAIIRRNLFQDYEEFNSLGPDAIDALAVGIFICDTLNKF